MTSMGLRRIGALVIVLAIALAGLEWCPGHRHPAEQSARQPSVSETANEPAPPPAPDSAEPERGDDPAPIADSPPGPRSGAARLIGSRVFRT